jgi:hypothetical protein
VTSPEDQSPRKVATVPTSSWKRGDPALLALLNGTVQGEQLDPGGCRIWVERRDGEIVPVVWPAGYHARLDPLELLDASGAVIAVVGTAISVPGGLMPTDPAAHSDVDEAFYVMGEIPAL